MDGQHSFAADYSAFWTRLYTLHIRLTALARDRDLGGNMIEGGKAAAILIIIGFLVFIVWAKSLHGKAALRSAFGDPYASHAKSKPKPRKRPSGRSTKPGPQKRSGR